MPRTHQGRRRRRRYGGCAGGSSVGPTTADSAPSFEWDRKIGALGVYWAWNGVIWWTREGEREA